jgi:DNA-binding transcriptional ArsR family regulator
LPSPYDVHNRSIGEKQDLCPNSTASNAYWRFSTSFTEEHLEWTPDELMAALGYSRPTLYRYLKTLKEAGFLTSMPSGGFTLGPARRRNGLSDAQVR